MVSTAVEEGRGSWNYRVMRRVDPDGTACYFVHEGYYDAAGKLKSWTEEPVEVVADSALEVCEVLGMMADAVGRPILDALTGAEVEPPAFAEPVRSSGNVVGLRHHAFEEGDVVRRKHGGPNMLVSVADPEIMGDVQCMWFGGPRGKRRLLTKLLPAGDLMLVARGTPS